jgi:hypothetical protein
MAHVAQPGTAGLRQIRKGRMMTGQGGWRAGVALVLVLATVATGAVADGVKLVSTEVAGSELRVGLSDGRVLVRDGLLGAVLGLTDEYGQPVNVRIDAVERDEAAPTGEVLLYTLTSPDGAGGWQAVCPPDPQGLNRAVLTQSEGGAVVIWCTAGVLAKCVRWGYAPWETAPDGRSLAPYHRACLQMGRAAYAGPDSPTTRDGMLIDIWDDAGINTPGGDMPFEAAWDEDGALCVAHTRVPQNMTLETLAATVPRLAGRTGAGCTAEAALAMGRPLLFNASRGDGIPGD